MLKVYNDDATYDLYTCANGDEVWKFNVVVDTGEIRTVEKKGAVWVAKRLYDVVGVIFDSKTIKTRFLHPTVDAVIDDGILTMQKRVVYASFE